jgi:TM2 domain-containing membrane protein YozV
MPIAPDAERQKPWEQRNVFVALILAVLVPGLGHLYQGRIVKGLIYLFGILGLFLWGVKLGEGIVVYNLPEKGLTRKVTLHYAAQFGAGLVSYPALWQNQRVTKNINTFRELDRPLTANFTGSLIDSHGDAAAGKLDGVIKLKPESGEYGPETRGVFSGKLNGQPIELDLGGNFFLDRQIAAGFRRPLKIGIVGGTDNAMNISGTIPRPFFDGYGVPPDPDQLQEVTGRLGKQHELALVFTWIAGLLNILAIWDCVQGPAYGFGDETWQTPNPDEKPDPIKLDPPIPATSATTPA